MYRYHVVKGLHETLQRWPIGMLYGMTIVKLALHFFRVIVNLLHTICPKVRLRPAAFAPSCPYRAP